MSFQFPDNRIRITVFCVTPIPLHLHMAHFIFSPCCPPAHCTFLQEQPGHLAVISKSPAPQTNARKSSSAASKNGNIGTNIHKSPCKEMQGNLKLKFYSNSIETKSKRSLCASTSLFSAALCRHFPSSPVLCFFVPQLQAASARHELFPAKLTHSRGCSALLEGGKLIFQFSFYSPKPNFFPMCSG